MSIIILFIFLLLSTLTTIIIFKNKFGKSLLITLFLNLITVFLSGVIFNKLSVGLIIGIIYSFLSIPLFIINKDKNEIKNNLLTVSFYSFLILFLIVTVFDFNRQFTMWDEFSHWGVMVKEMVRLDTFYTVDNSTLLVHKDYPPIISILEYIFCKLSLGYKESIVYISVHTFIISLFLPFIDKIEINIKNIIKIGLTIGSFILIILLFDTYNIINTVYIDYILSYLVIFLICFILFEKNLISKTNLLIISLGLSILLLTKQISIAFYLMIVFLLIIKLFKKEYLKIDYIKNNYKKLLLIILLLIVPIALSKIWTNYTYKFDIPRQFNISDIKFLELPKLFKGVGEEYKIITLKNYINGLFNISLTDSKFLNLSYVWCTLIYLVLLIILLIFRKDKKNLIKYGITILIGSIGYAFLMLNLYVFCFGPYEGPELASFNRYMSTYILIEYLSLFIIFIKDTKLRNIIILFIILSISIRPSRILKLKPVIKYQKNKYEIISDNIKSYDIKKYSNIFLTSPSNDGSYQFYVKYYLGPYRTNLENYNNDINNIKEYIKGYDYVYDLDNNKLYEVKNDNNVYKIKEMMH